MSHLRDGPALVKAGVARAGERPDVGPGAEDVQYPVEWGLHLVGDDADRDKLWLCPVLHVCFLQGRAACPFP
jgi:hypothetical protein